MDSVSPGDGSAGCSSAGDDICIKKHVNNKQWNKVGD